MYSSRSKFSPDPTPSASPSPAAPPEPPRAALERHAASQGHPSVEAWLRAASLIEVDLEAVRLLSGAVKGLTEDEEQAAADLLFSFVRRGPDGTDDWGVFHPSLIGDRATEHNPLDEVLPHLVREPSVTR
jgi:hypothetical protein